MNTHQQKGTTWRKRSAWLGLAGLLLVALLPFASLARGPAGEAGDLQGIYEIGQGGRPTFRHNVGLLDLMITNLGVIGKANFVDEYGAGWRGGEYLYAAAMWIGAIASDNLAYVSTGAYEYELRPSLDPVDTIYPSYEGAPGGNRPGFSAKPDDDGDGLIDEDFPNGKDDDGDGLIDEDYSGVSQQMFSCEYWDYTEEARNRYPEHRPLNVRVRQQSFAWSTEGANEFVGFDFQIINDGFELLRQVYLGFFVDSDAGPRDNPDYYTDDRGAYYSTDTTFVDRTIEYTCTDTHDESLQFNCAEQKIHLDICYMYDVPDDGETAKGRDVPGFFGGMFLGHTTDPSGETAPKRVEVHTARFFNGSNAYPAGDPTNDAERYDLLQSGIKIQRPTGVPDDYRYCFSAGPFRELAPGNKLTLQVAFVIGDGKEGMLTNALNAQRIYNGKWRDVDDNPETGVDGKETCLRARDASEALEWKDPCDSLNPTTRIVKETVCIPENYVDDDCDCCTPLLNKNERGLETLVHWVGDVAPPPPGTNIDDPNGENPVAPGVATVAPAGDRKVVIAWDNLSELTASPIQKKILFSGYKIWRVEGWDRPIGSAGPSPEEWEMIANLSFDPPDGDSTASPFYLGRYKNDVDSLYSVTTGSEQPGEDTRWYYPVGRYTYVDSLGLKNGMIYFYDVTAYSAWDTPDTTFNQDGSYSVAYLHTELGSRPSATERDGVRPVWSAAPMGDMDNIYVVPNPYIRGKNPDGWDLTPSNADPTGTKLAFVGLPDQECTIKIYTLAGDLVQTLGRGASDRGGAVYWNMISRNGQDIVSGIYLYAVECGGKRKVGRFVVVR